MYTGNYRQSIVDLWRFIASLLIMSFHVWAGYIYISSGVEYPFQTAWIYVEFFFILSGYFTILHFEKIEVHSLEDAAKNSIYYTIKKYFMFFPYVVVATSIYYFLECISEECTIGVLINYTFDVLLLTSSFYEQFMPMRPLWFLTALFIAFPIFCLMCQIKSKNFLYMLSFYVPLYYYGRYDLQYAPCTFPWNVLRALAALFLGVFVYALCAVLKKMKFSAVHKVCLTFIEMAMLLSMVYFTYKNKLQCRFFMLCFVVGLTVMLSQQSYTSRIDSPVFRWLGKISMPMFIFHTVIAKIINVFFNEWTDISKILFFYVGTFVVSAVIYHVIENIKLKRKRLMNGTRIAE